MTRAFDFSRRSLLGGVAGLGAGALLGTRSARAAPVRGGRLVYGRYADSQFLDPVLNDANVDIWVFTNLYDTLLQPTRDGTGVQPGLATAWEWGPGNRSLTLRLREGVKFADGSPLQVDDVVWSLDRARNEGPWRSLVGSIDRVEGGNGQVTIQLKQPDATLLAALATFNTGILPKRLFEAAAGATSEAKAQAFAEHPIGTGPFVMTEWRRGQYMVLRKNPHYWRPGEDGQPLPYVDELRFEIIPDDATRLLKLRAGEIDGTEFVPYARVAELQADQQMRMELWPSTRVRYLGFSCRPEYRGARNPLADPKVRQALNYAVNKDAVIAITTRGLGRPTRSFMSSTTPMFHGPAPLYAFDQARARALLAEAGFANGFELTILALSGNQDDLNDTTTVQQMWAPLNVRLNIEQVDSATRTARYRARDYQMRTAAWTNDISDPSQITSYFAYSPNIDNLYSGWKDERVDQLYVESGRETDVPRRTAIFREIQERYSAAAPILFLYETPYPVAWRRNAEGFVQIPLGNNLFEAAYVRR